MATSKKNPPYVVAVGDVYVDNDPYFSPPRRLPICRVDSRYGYFILKPGGKERKIALKRFVNTRKGYRLVERGGKPVNDPIPKQTPEGSKQMEGFED